MFVRMNSYVEIQVADKSRPALVFRNQVNSVEVETSWKFITQKATINLPRLKKLLEEKSLTKINAGDTVLIQLGYNGNMRTEFEGYVSEVSPRTPLEIKCEDEMWKLKQDTVTKGWGTVKMKDIILYLVPEADVSQVYDITLSNFTIDHTSRAKALEKLMDETGLAIYYRDKKIFCGFPYTELGLPEVNYHFQKNIPKDEGKKSLTFLTKEMVKLKVRAISMLPNNKHLEVILGDEGGSEITLHFYNCPTKDMLTKMATEKLKTLKYDGYRGSLLAFGQPFVTHSMIANITDTEYPERSGKYFIDKVKTKYGHGGLRREVEFGLRADAA